MERLAFCALLYPLPSRTRQLVQNSPIPRRRHRVIIRAVEGTNANASNIPSQSQSQSQPTPRPRPDDINSSTACFIACVECGAVYAVDAEELDVQPRAVQCSLCRHEWLASERDILWGVDHARVVSVPRAAAAARAAACAAAAATAPRAWESATSGAVGITPGLADGGGDALLDDEEEEEDESGVEGNGIHIFIGNLSFRANEQDLRRAFSAYGRVKMAHIPTDPQGASKGYGFVQMTRRSEGLRAIEALQGVSVVGRDIALSEARPRNGQNQQGSDNSTSNTNTKASGNLNDSSKQNYHNRRYRGGGGGGGGRNKMHQKDNSRQGTNRFSTRKNNGGSTVFGNSSGRARK